METFDSDCDTKKRRYTNKKGCSSSARPSLSNTKRALKFLAVCPDRRVHKAILTHSSDQLLKRICNAALNAERGDVRFSNPHKRILAEYRRPISILTNPAYPLCRKRKLLVQKGGGLAAIILPIILSGVLSTLGSTLFGKR